MNKKQKSIILILLSIILELIIYTNFSYGVTIIFAILCGSIAGIGLIGLIYPEKIGNL